MPTGPAADFSTGAGAQVSFPYKTPLSPYNNSGPGRSKGKLGEAWGHAKGSQPGSGQITRSR